MDLHDRDPVKVGAETKPVTKQFRTNTND